MEFEIVNGKDLTEFSVGPKLENEFKDKFLPNGKHFLIELSHIDNDIFMFDSEELWEWLRDKIGE